MELCTQPWDIGSMEYSFRFTKTIIIPWILPTNAELVETDKFYGIFPRPEILVRRTLPMKYYNDRGKRRHYYDDSDSDDSGY